MTADNYFVQLRQDWIAETLKVFGFIQRGHLERKFNISTQQASFDIGKYIDDHPGEIEYNANTKRYERTKA